MNLQEQYREACITKLPLIRQWAGGRNIWIYGAGKGGKILMDVLTENQISICGFLDRNAKEIVEKWGYPVRWLQDRNPKEDFITISVWGYDESIFRILKKQGFVYKDCYYVSMGVFVNKEDIFYKGCSVGRYTYGYEELLKYYPLVESIGRFCSINGTARVWNNHPIEYVTTSPFLDHPLFYSWEQLEERKRLVEKYGRHHANAPFENSALRDNRPIIIGNDVWVGANVIILPGVHIGDGAVLAAGAVVTKDVSDYTIVGGVPAQVIRYRFKEEQIEALKRIRWWDWELDAIEDRLELLYQPEKMIEVYG